MQTPKWLLIALAISLAANLALGGFLAGRMTGGALRPAPVDPALAFVRVVRELPDDRQAALAPLVREQFRSARGSVRDLRRAQRDITAALTSEPFDDAALTQALERFRTALLASQEASHATLVPLVAAMTPEERVRFEKAMRRQYPRSPGSRDRGERRPPRTP
jgi:uncharacterized membrane protein